MIITPQARRRITSAVMELSDEARDRWGQWARKYGPAEPCPDVPYSIAEVALQAVTAAARAAEWRLQQQDLHEDVRSDLLNDLGYLQSLETALRAENIGL